MCLATVVRRLARPYESTPKLIFNTTMQSNSPNNDWHTQTTRSVGNGIGYSADLVPKLIDDHRRILQMFADIGIACLQSEGTMIVPNLLQFSRALTEHLVTENSRLYVYMRRSVATDDVKKQRISVFRKEMIAVTNAVGDFIEKYKLVTTWTPDLLESFKNDLMVVGEVLVNRIESEETDLFAIYQPAEVRLEN